MTDLLTYLTQEPSFLRLPLWRWAEVHDALANGSAGMDIQDKYVREAVIYQKAKREQDRTGSKNPLPHPEVGLAYELYSKSSEHAGFRWVTEALIMAGLSDRQIQFHIPMARKAFEYYRRLFFDVDDYLNNPLCVIANVFSTSYHMGGSFCDCNFAWKILAYQFKEQITDWINFIVGFGSAPADILKHVKEHVTTEALYRAWLVIRDPRMLKDQHSRELLSMVLGKNGGGKENESLFGSVSRENEMQELYDTKVAIQARALRSTEMLPAIQMVSTSPSMDGLMARITDGGEPMLTRKPIKVTINEGFE